MSAGTLVVLMTACYDALADEASSEKENHNKVWNIDPDKLRIMPFDEKYKIENLYKYKKDPKKPVETNIAIHNVTIHYELYKYNLHKENNPKAITYLMLSAYSGHPYAQLLLANRYEIGDGVPVDYRRAYINYYFAYQQNRPEEYQKPFFKNKFELKRAELENFLSKDDFIWIENLIEKQQQHMIDVAQTLDISQKYKRK